MFKNLVKLIALLGLATAAHAQTVTDFQRNNDGATILQNTNLGRMPAAANQYGRIFNDAAKVVSGNLDMTDANSAVTLVNDGYNSVTIYYTRTAQTGNIIPQYSLDGTNWLNALYYSSSAGSTANTPLVSSNNVSFAGQEILKVEASGYPFVRIKVFSAGTGTLPVYLVGKTGQVFTAINNILPGTAAANLGKAEDSGHITGDVGVFSLGVGNTNGASVFCASGDYCPMATSTAGLLYSIPMASSDSNSAAKNEDTVHVSSDGGMSILGVQRAAPGAIAATGDYAPILTSSDTGGTFTELTAGSLTTNPARLEDAPFAGASAVIVQGRVRQDTLTSDVSNDGDIVVAKTDAFGRQPVALQQNRTGVKMATVVTVTNTTETTLVAAGGAGVFNDLTLVACINTSATPVRVDIRDATAGTVRFPLYVPAGDMRGYMNPILIPQTTAANNWTFQASASVTDLRCWAGYITNQ